MDTVEGLENTVIVACEADSTRVQVFSVGSRGAVCVEALKSPDEDSEELPALLAALTGGESAITRFIDMLVAVVSSCNVELESLVIGTTSEVQDTLQSGLMKRFETCLLEREDFGEDVEVSFTLLTERTEALYAHAALAHVAASVFPSSPQLVSMLCSSGATCHLAFCRDSVATVPEILTISSQLIVANRKILDTGLEHAIAWLDDALTKDLASTNLLGRLKGTFGVIELLGTVGDQAGIGSSFVTQPEAVARITASLEEWRLASSLDEGMTAAVWSCRGFHGCILAMLVLRLLSLLHPSTSLYFASSWKLPTSETLRPSWPLGVYLDSGD